MKLRLNLKAAFSWKNIRLNILICAAITLLLTVVFYLQYQSSFLLTLIKTFIYSYSIGFSIYFFLTAVLFDIKEKILHFVLVLIRILMATLFGAVSANLIFAIMFGIRPDRVNFTSAFFLLFAGMFFGLSALVIFYLYHLSEKRKYKQLEEQQKKTKAELQALVAQINPHFLFNTLNTISSLIHIDPSKADEMVIMLSNVFRYSLQSGKKRFVSIAEEVKVVEHYLQIEKVRFSDRLNYTINVDKSCQEYAIPPLILQTLVENSVKHGISPKPEGGEIIIEISEKHENIEIRIEDDGVGMKDEVTAGFGLDAVKNILALQYKKHRFNLVNDNGVKIQITIPRMGINDEL